MVGAGKLHFPKSRLRLELPFPFLPVVVFHFLSSLFKTAFSYFQARQPKTPGHLEINTIYSYCNTVNAQFDGTHNLVGKSEEVVARGRRCGGHLKAERFGSLAVWGGG